MHHHARSFAFAALALLIAVIVLATPRTAWAHNSLVGSEPADGATLDVAPTQIVWNFDNAVPLETLTVTLIDPSGVRSELAGSTYGPEGETQVVTPLPALSAGDVSLRWRLVSPDGHAITGRVDVVVAAGTTTTVAAAATSVATPVTTLTPATTIATTTVVTAAARDDGGSVDDGTGDGAATAAPIGWILRYASYLAIVGAVGVLVTGVFVWGGAGQDPVLRRVVRGSLLAVAVLALVQLLVLAGDIGGTSPFSAWGSIDGALTTDAGVGLLVRAALALTTWLIVARAPGTDRDVNRVAATLTALGLLGTWAMAGHSNSQRWPTLGVLSDIAHHAAAAGWLGGLAIIGLVVIPRAEPAVVVGAVRNFATVAATCVAILVLTGVLQSLRLDGNPLELLATAHGRLLAAKVVAFGVMLALANLNRRRLDGALAGFADRAGGDRGAAGHTLRQVVLAEFAIGLAIVGITAAMVVSTPASA